MNAKVSRQASDFVDLVERLKARGGHVDALIIQMGNNGPLYSEEMEALRRATAGVGEVFLVNDLAPVSWSGESDNKLSEAARTWPHTELIDWRSVVDGHQGTFTWDGLHLTPAGAGAYTRLITSAVRSKVAWPKSPQGRGERENRRKSHNERPGTVRSRHESGVNGRGKGRGST
jgi:hypothetical protein